MTLESGPKMPQTPSHTINKMLRDRCGKQHTNVVKAGLAYYICGFFQVITTFYNAINPDQNAHSHKLWMTACTVISCLVVLKAYLVYNIIMASAFVMHTLLYYGATAMALFGVGLGVSGAVFFDKDGAKYSSNTGSTSTKASSYSSSTSTSSSPSSTSASLRKAPTPPATAADTAKFVPQKVKEYETNNPAATTTTTTHAQPSAPPQTEMASTPTSGTHGSATTPEASAPATEVKKDI